MNGEAGYHENLQNAMKAAKIVMSAMIAVDHA